jgi:hypothetical protein
VQYRHTLTFNKRGEHTVAYTGPVASVADPTRTYAYDFPNLCGFANPAGAGLVVPGRMVGGDDEFELELVLRRADNWPACADSMGVSFDI